MTQLTVESFEELESLLRNWVNFQRNGDYDVVGMMLLLKACLENLRQHSLDTDFEELENFFSTEELTFLEELLQKLK
jgi:hypothetical protein